MMGRSHAASGVLAGMVSLDLAGTGAADQLGWVVVVSGAALLPDLDMPRSTVGRLWGPMSSGLRVRYAGGSVLLVPGVAHAVRAIAGGHRQGTHSLVGIAVAMLLVWLAGLWVVSSAVLVAIATGLVILAVDFWVPGRMHWFPNLVVSAGMGGVAHEQGWRLPGWLALAIGIGMFVHCWGDEITKQRVPWWWPIYPREHVPRPSWWRIRTGGRAEHVVLWVIGVAVVVVLLNRAGLNPVGAVLTAIVPPST